VRCETGVADNEQFMEWWQEQSLVAENRVVLAPSFCLGMQRLGRVNKLG